MRLNKLRALIYLDIRVLMHTKERLIETLFFPLASTFIWGFFALSFKSFSPEYAMALLITNIFWSFFYLAQSTPNLLINNDIWSHSLNQLLASGVSELEYITARILLSGVMSVFVMGLMLLAGTAFGLIVPAFGPLVVLLLVSLIAAAGLSLIVAGLFILLGKEYAFLSWTTLQVVVMFSAPFFPVSTYPALLQPISKAIPMTWLFESLRSYAATGAFNQSYILTAFILSVAMLCLAIPFYLWVFKQARKSGMLVRFAH